MRPNIPCSASWSFWILFLLFGLCCSHANEGHESRRVLNLDGVWQIAEGALDHAPTEFQRTVPVPGLVSLAQPAFVAPGPKVADRQSVLQKDPRRDAFWYKRAFRVAGPLPAVAILKIHKAMFGTRVFLNGKLLGDHAPCFTPGYFDARAALRQGENDLLLRIGADREAVGPGIPSGFDFEKERYIPGIFDHVELILSGSPHIQNVQAAPDSVAGNVRVQMLLQNSGPRAATITPRITVRESKSRRVAGALELRPATVPAGSNTVIEALIPIVNCMLWSPDTPFLYLLDVDIGTDSWSSYFGMREFKLDPVAGRAMLNGKPFLMRGSNITLYRFFEDPKCGKLPWDSQWVRLLHKRIKDMHWNCLRYCIGFPPEEWYRIADEEGILIQDEFPIWFGGQGWSKWPAELNSKELAAEYAEWMQERWNHPSVVIWDANNETTSAQTAPAIRQVRGLDLSNRPWDNSYAPPQEPGDVFESHPYHFYDATYRLSKLAAADPVPQGSSMHNDGKHAVVINEYGWLWLNRDGTPTTLTKQLYQNLLGTNSTAAQRRHLYALYTAAETEFWRAHRKAAAVMHFTTLGYSRPDGQTSDHWNNVVKLQWEPEFYKYVRDAFAPVALCIEFWEEKAVVGHRTRIPVLLSNDREQPWTGVVTLRLKSGRRELAELEQFCSLQGLGQATLDFDLNWPEQTGLCVLEAQLRGPTGLVHSVRELEITP